MALYQQFTWGVLVVVAAVDSVAGAAALFVYLICIMKIVTNLSKLLRPLLYPADFNSMQIFAPTKHTES